MKEFKVNDYITLKLENKKTNIYIKGELFRQCKFLLLNISVDKISTFDDIDSVDEIAERLDKSMEESKILINISPREEFWAHCSNIQVWAENNYDTRLLHCSLAFYLLEALVKAGDPLAIKVFKEEIAKRLGSGVESVVNFIFNEDFIGNYLNKEEFLMAYLEEQELNHLYQLENELNFELHYCYKATDPNTFHIENKKVVIINLNGNKLKKIPKTISKFKHLKLLTVYGNNITSISKNVSNLKYLKISGLNQYIL